MSPLATWSLILVIWLGVGFVLAVAVGKWIKFGMGDDEDDESARQ